MMATIWFAFIAVGLMSGIESVSRADSHPVYHSAVNFWPFDKSTRLQDVRTNKTATLYGKWKSMVFPGPGNGFLQNNGQAHADMGDYKGQCLAEPQKCQPALSVGFWFRYTPSSNYKQQVYLGTASLNENSQGFALYMDPVNKKTSRFTIKVNDGKTMWKCNFKQPPSIWAHIGFIWKAKTGLLLYKDCSLICTNNTGVSMSIPTPSGKGMVRQSLDANHFFLGRGNGLGVFKDVKASFDDLAVWYQRLRAKEIGGEICKRKLEPPQISQTCTSTLTSLAMTWTLPPYTYDMLRGTRVSSRKLFAKRWKTLDVNTTSVNFPNLEPFSYHEFRVQNKLTKGYGRTGERIVCRVTDPSKTLNLSLVSRTINSFTVKWSPPRGGHKVVEIYMIKYKLNGTWDNFRMMDAGRNLTERIRKLQPNSQYTVQLITIGNEHFKPIAAVEKVFTTAKIVLGRPSDIKADGRSSSAVLIRWSQPKKYADKVKGYKIKYREKDSSEDFASYDVGDVTSFLITSLKTNANYEVHIISCGDDQVLPSPPRTKTIRTDPDDSLTAQYRKAVPLGPNTVSVIWKRPEKKFKEFKYRVYLKWEKENRRHCREVCYKVISPNCTASVKNIPFPRTFYIISWIVRDVTPRPVTAPVMDVTVTHMQWNKVTLSWKEPISSNGTRFAFLEYKIYLKHENEVRNKTTKKRKTKLDGLQQRTKYLLNIRAVNPVSRGPLLSKDISFTTPARDYCLGKTVCHSAAVCIPARGSYWCKCGAGYIGDGRTCSALPADATNEDFCPGEEHAGVTWNKTFKGVTDRNPCPKGTKGIALRKCRKAKEGRPAWSQPDLSNCVSVWMADINKQLQSGEVNAKFVASRLANLTDTKSGKKVYPGDLLLLVNAIGILSGKGLNSSDTTSTPEQSKQFSKAVFSTASNILDSTNLETWNYIPKASQASSAGDLIKSLDAVGLELVSRVSDAETTTANIDMKVKSLDDKTRDKSLTLREDKGNAKNPGSAVTFPRSVMGPGATGKGAPRYLTYVNFKSIGSLMVSPPEKSEMSVNSPVMSLTLSPLNQREFHKPVVIILRHSEIGERTEPSCVFWNTSRRPGFWSNEGCEVHATNKTHTECHCYHLTCFAVLMAVDSRAIAAIEGDHLIALSLITYIGIGLSVICLVLAFFTFTTFRFLKSTRTFIHKNLAISLALAELVFMFGINKTENELVCKVVAIALHYLFLVAFAWMALEGVVLYLLLVKVFETKKSPTKNKKVFFACAWLIPAIVVVVSGAINHQGYGTNDYCWLSLDKGFIWAFVGPVLAIIAFNFVCLGITFNVMARRGSYKNKDSVDKIRYWVKGATLLTCILGLTWMFGVFFVNGISIFMAYFFTIFNALQGVFIFAFHCICDSKIRREYKRILCCRSKHGEYLLTKGSSSRADTFAKVRSTDDEPKNGPKILNSNVYKATVLVGNGTNGRVMVYGGGDEAVNKRNSSASDASDQSDNEGADGENPRNSLLNKQENGIELMRLKGSE